MTAVLSKERIAELPTFAIEGTTILPKNRGMVFAVTLDRDTENFGHLLGKHVLLDPGMRHGGVFAVSGVERSAHNPPWRKGEKIGLLATIVRTH